MAEGEKAIAVAGAGSIGCHAGACLALAGRKVSLLARPSTVASIRHAGIRVTDLDGSDQTAAPAALTASTDAAEALKGADIVLVTVKSRDTLAMAEAVAIHAPAEAVVVSLQNGVRNADRLRRALPGRTVLAGMVPFNVVQSEPGMLPFHVHRASEGTVLVDQNGAGVETVLSVPGFPVAAHADMGAVQWGKLLFNLNNALVALSDLTLVSELSDRRWRRVLAAQIDEALAAMKAAGIRPLQAAGPPPWTLPFVLRLPDGIFRALARRMLAIDPQARSSMWEDLQRRRPTEIDELQGAVLELAASAGTQAPVVKRVAELIRRAERVGGGSPKLGPAAVVEGIA